MTRSVKIALFLTFISIVSGQSASPAAVLDSFCPCSPAAQCSQIFGGGDNLIFADILRAIPPCPSAQVRCCSKDVMFAAIMTIVRNHANGSPQAGVQSARGAITAPAGVQSARGAKTASAGVQPASASRLTPPEGIGVGGFLQQRSGSLNNPAKQAVQPRASAFFPKDSTQGQEEEGLDQLFGSTAGTASAFDQTVPESNQKGDDSGAFRIPAGARQAGGSNLGLQQQVAPRQSPAAAEGGSGRVVCLPAASCPPQNIYGTSPEHFAQFGFVSPSENNCLADSGNILCVMGDANEASVPAPVLPQPAAPGFPLPCVAAASCSETFGTKAIHLNEFGPQTPCLAPGQVRCVSSDPVQSPVQSAGQGDALPQGISDLLNSISPQANEPVAVPEVPTAAVNNQLPDLTVPVNKQLPDPTVPVFNQLPDPTVPVFNQLPDLTVPDLSPLQAPATPVFNALPVPVVPVLDSQPTPELPSGSAPSISIIGPQPIYISYDTVKGPTVGAGGELHEHGRIQPTPNASQDSQIRVLVEALRQKLQSIIANGLN